MSFRSLIRAFPAEVFVFVLCIIIIIGIAIRVQPDVLPPTSSNPTKGAAAATTPTPIPSTEPVRLSTPEEQTQRIEHARAEGVRMVNDIVQSATILALRRPALPGELKVLEAEKNIPQDKLPKCFEVDGQNSFGWCLDGLNHIQRIIPAPALNFDERP